MSDTTTENVTDDADPIAGLGSSMEDIESALGLEPETPEEREALARGEDLPEKKAPAADKDEDEKSAKGDEDEGAKKDEKSAEDKALEEWMGVRKRAKERRAARDASARGEPGVSAAPAAAATAKAKEPDPAAAAAPAKESDVKSAVADIIKALSRLDDEDGDQAAGAKTDADVEKIAASAKREVDVGLIKEKLGLLADKIEASEKLEGKFGEIKAELDARVKEIEDTTLVYGHAERTISTMEDKLPYLSKRRDAAALIVREAANFLERTEKAPPMAFVAERVERVLARRAQEQEGASAPPKNGKPKGAPEKQHPSRKTTSSSLATPPSRRQGDDTRTPEQVERDLYTSLGLDADA